jgi:P-type DNA transfer protein virB5
MKLKAKLTAAAVATSILFSSVVSAGGIPTFSATEFAQAVQQVAELKKQYDQLKEQFKAITGSRGLGNILTSTGLKSALPQDWQKVYDAIRTGGYKGLDGAAKAIVDASKLVEKCKPYKDGSEQQRTCQNAAVRTAQTQSNIQQALENTDKRLTNLSQLAKKINETKDPKAVQELIARIGVEQAAIQNEQTRLQLFMKLADEQERTAQQEARAARAARVREVNAKF